MTAKDFDDDEHVIRNTQGVLAGGAFDEVETIREKATTEGFEFQCTCNNCTRPAKILVPWDELITAAAGAVPYDQQLRRQWTMQPTQRGGNVMFPAAFCQCGTQYPIVFTPDKAQRMVRVGISMQALDPQKVTQQIQYVQQQMGAYRR